MEVHAHSHNHEKKTWKAYFWEFLMLFLAVFCGFLAENQREHMVEHNREKKYARELLSDLRADSAFLVKLSTYLDSTLRWNEEFDSVMSSGTADNYNILMGYIKLQFIISMSPTTATYSEMRSSGSFRYIQNDELARLLKKYYEQNLAYLKTNEEMGKDFFNKYIQPFTISHFNIKEIDFINNKILTPSPTFLNRTRDTEIQLLNIMNLYGMYYSLYRENAVKPTARTVNKLIILLKENYHLK
jgi:hypothetical protein